MKIHAMRTCLEKAPTRRRRRGFAVLLVLLLLSMTLGLSYAAMRGQSTLFAIQRNSQRRGSARQAAITGMTMALKKIQTSAWAGVDTTLSGALESGVRFEVSYTTGDPRLTSSSPDYAELPFRVTLLSTGYAADPATPQNISTWQVRAVVRLVPRQLSNEPADWNEIRKHTFYQWTSGDAKINSPCRIEGTARFQGAVTLSEGVEWSDTIRSRFLSDLWLMRLLGMPDWRPFSGKVELPFTSQPALTLPLLDAMGVTRINTATRAVPQPSAPLLNTYRLYPGGKAYNAQTLAKSLRAVSLKPDPLTNPAGIFSVAGVVDVYDDVQINGTVVIRKDGQSDLNFWGIRIGLAAVSLPSLDGDDAAVRLPVVITDDDVRAYGDTELTVDGFISCADNFDIQAGSQSSMQVTIHGGIVAKDIQIVPRWEWQCGGATWTSLYNGFKMQEPWPGGIRYFPDWLNRATGLKPPPKLLIAPPTSAVRDHWQFADQPIYVPATGDGGLRWELLDWTERL